MVLLQIDTQEKKMIMPIDLYIKATKGRWTVDKYKVIRLKTGDYITEDYLVGFERKGMDLIGSLYGGTLRQQLYELSSAVRYPYLILQFDSIQDIVESFHQEPNVVIGLLSSVLAKSGVPYILGGRYFVPHMIRVIHKHYEAIKSHDEYVPIRPMHIVKQKATIKEWKLCRFQTLPNVGPGLANRIYEHFEHSYTKAINAPIEEWKKIPGISDGIAKKIQKVIK